MKLIFIYSFLLMLFLTGCQSAPESKKIEEPAYQVSKPLVKDMSLN